LAGNQVHVLTAEQALLVQAIKSFSENSTGRTMHRTAGEKWFIVGPKEYWPPLEVKVIRPVPRFVVLFRPDTIVLAIIVIVISFYILSWIVLK